MRRLLGVLLCLVPSVAAADGFEVVGGGESDVRELSHSIDVTVEPGAAILHVERTIQYSGSKKADVGLHVDLPQGGVITSAKLQSSGEVEVQGEGPGALLFFPEMKGKRSVSYRIEVPLEPEEGQATIWLPQATKDEAFQTPVVRLGGEVLVAKDNPAWDPVTVPLPTPDTGAARWGVAKFSSGWVWRAEVDAPESLSKPTDAENVIFLLDISRSQGPKGVGRQLALLHEWARQMPRAQYQVVAYARDADVVFPTWKGPDGIRDLGPGHAKLVLQNGSNLDGALEVAASLLSEREGATFVLIATDGEVPTAVMPKAMSQRLDRLGRDAAAHLIITSGRHTRGAIESRADDHRLAPIALDHGGVPMKVYLPEEWPEPPEAVALANLLRATRIDRVDVELDGKAQKGADAWGRLYERRSIVAMGRTKSSPSKAKAIGLKWGRRWELSAVRTEAVDRRAAIFAGNQLDLLSAAELGELGKKHSFVTERTAIKATRSSSEIVDPRETGLARNAIGVGRGSGSGSKTSTPAGELPVDTVKELFAAAYQPCVAHYRGPASTLQVSLEMSWNEILDVASVGGDVATNLCVEEAIWAVDLPDEHKDPHAFGMIEVPLAASTEDDEADGEDGPPETEAGRSGGCRVASEPEGSGWLWFVLVLVLGRRRR